MNSRPAAEIAFLFDMDGVLIHSNPTHTQAWIRYLAAHGLAFPDIERRMIGKRNDEIVREFFAGQDLDEAAVARHGAAKEELYREMMGPEFDAHVVAGVAAFLEGERGRRRIGLATNAEPPNVDFVLDRAGLRDCFQAIVSGHDVERPKPYPDVYLRCADLLGVEPARCVVFEDSYGGARAGRAAGMRVVGVTTTHDSFPDVDLTIEDFRSPRLREWLSRLERLAET